MTDADTSKYMFFIELEEGEVVEWRGLTLAKAKQMNACTSQTYPGNVKRFGWELIKETSCTWPTCT